LQADFCNKLLQQNAEKIFSVFQAGDLSHRSAMIDVTGIL